MSQPSVETKPEEFTDVKLAILDVDDTLVFASDRHGFYGQYGAAVVATIAERFELDAHDAEAVAMIYRQQRNGGEQALFRGDVGKHFPDITSKPPDVALLYDRMCTIDPSGKFINQSELRTQLQAVRAIGVKVVVLTSSPEPLSRRILAESGYSPDADFDQLIGYTRAAGPPKMLGGAAIFQDIASSFGVLPGQVLAAGDSLAHDVLPPHGIGMIARWIHAQPNEQWDDLRVPTTAVLLQQLLTAKRAG